MSKPPLRALDDDESPDPPKPPMTLAEAIESGVYLEILRATRRDLGAALPNEKGPAKAAMFRQFLEVAKEIATLEGANDPNDPGGASATGSDAGAGDSAFDEEAI